MDAMKEDGDVGQIFRGVRWERVGGSPSSFLHPTDLTRVFSHHIHYLSTTMR